MEVRRDEWEAHEKVLLHGSTAGDTQWILDRTMGGSLRGSTNLLTLMRGIVSWTLTDERGIGLPWPEMGEADWDNPMSKAYQARMASLSSLMQEDVNFLVNRLNALNAPNSKEEQEAFLASTGAGNPAAPSPSTAQSSEQSSTGQ
jgi:hypothetical protein